MIASKAEAEAAGGNEEVKEEIKEETEEEEHPSSTRRQVACGRREGYSHRQPRRQIGQPWLTKFTSLERDRNLAVNVGRSLFEDCRRRVHDL